MDTEKEFSTTTTTTTPTISLSPSSTTNIIRILHTLPTLFIPLLTSIHREVVNSVFAVLTALIGRTYLDIQILQPHLPLLVRDLFL
jgi:hypothetical protein